MNWYEDMGDYCACRCWMNNHDVGRCSKTSSLFVINGHSICPGCLTYWKEGVIVSLAEVVLS